MGTSVKLVCYFSLVRYVTRPNLCSPILNWFMFDLRAIKIGMCSLECVDDDRVLGPMIWSTLQRLWLLQRLGLFWVEIGSLSNLLRKGRDSLLPYETQSFTPKYLYQFFFSRVDQHCVGKDCSSSFQWYHCFYSTLNSQAFLTFAKIGSP